MTLAEIRKSYHQPVIAVHEIGPYVIVEFHPEKFVRGAWSRHNGYLMDRSAFHSYVGGVDTNYQHDSLDAALAHAIAYRAEGCNSRAGYYFIKMIGA